MTDTDHIINETPSSSSVSISKHEDPSDMTFSRRAARYLSKFSWYYPRLSKNASLEAAWFHYEHVTLARCYENGDQYFENDFVRASQSERRFATRLYPVWETPLKELADFGVSQRMFFSSLLVMAGIMFLAGLLNVPLMIYFWGYAGDNKEGVDYMGTNTIRGSALCDATEWVECASCNAMPEEYPSYRLDGTNVRRNLCDFDSWLVPGLCSFVASVILLVLMGLAFWKQRAAEVVLDEQVQTASDYSVKVNNPPPDATNPHEWRQFFNQYACDQGKGVVLVTIALNNANLIRALVQRRRNLKALSNLLPLGTDMTDRPTLLNLVVLSENSWLATLTCGLLQPNIRQLWDAIQLGEDQIRAFSQQDFQAVAVFATFETERAQRNALHALTTGRIHVWRNQRDPTTVGDDGMMQVFEAIHSRRLWDLTSGQQERTIRLTNTLDDSPSTVGLLMFRNCHVLSVKEAVEPSDVRWIDLQASHRQRFELYLGSSLGMVIFVLWSGLFIFQLVDDYPGYYATVFITLVSPLIVSKASPERYQQSH